MVATRNEIVRSTRIVQGGVLTATSIDIASSFMRSLQDAVMAATRNEIVRFTRIQGGVLTATSIDIASSLMTSLQDAVMAAISTEVVRSSTDIYSSIRAFPGGVMTAISIDVASFMRACQPGAVVTETSGAGAQVVLRMSMQDGDLPTARNSPQVLHIPPRHLIPPQSLLPAQCIARTAAVNMPGITQAPRGKYPLVAACMPPRIVSIVRIFCHTSSAVMLGSDTVCSHRWQLPQHRSKTRIVAPVP
jgi:hypothetical protein